MRRSSQVVSLGLIWDSISMSHSTTNMEVCKSGSHILCLLYVGMYRMLRAWRNLSLIHCWILCENMLLQRQDMITTLPDMPSIFIESWCLPICCTTLLISCMQMKGHAWHLTVSSGEEVPNTKWFYSDLQILWHSPFICPGITCVFRPEVSDWPQVSKSQGLCAFLLQILALCRKRLHGARLVSSRLWVRSIWHTVWSRVSGWHQLFVEKAFP